MTVTFKHLEAVCKALGLNCKNITKGRLWSGIINGQVVRIVIHVHCEGRDIATGTFNKYLKQLGFGSAEDFMEYLRSL